MAAAFMSILLLMVARHHPPSRRKIKEIWHGHVYLERSSNTTMLRSSNTSKLTIQNCKCGTTKPSANNVVHQPFATDNKDVLHFRTTIAAGGIGYPLPISVLPIKASMSFGNHAKRIFLLKGNAVSNWKSTCFRNSLVICIIGKPCPNGKCGMYNSAFFSVSSGLSLDGAPQSVSRKIDDVWFDIVRVRKVLPLKSFLTNKKVTVKENTYASFSRKKMYELATCTTNCPLDPLEIMKLAMVDFLCQNHDRLNREFQNMRGDNLVHIFVNTQTKRLQYIDNNCNVHQSYTHKPNARTVFDVDGQLDTRFLFEIAQLFNTSVKTHLYDRHVNTVESFMDRTTGSLKRIHNLDPRFVVNLKNRVKVLAGIMKF